MAPNKQPFLIAEIGINHNGDMAIAKKIMDSAADAGFDAVKFQKRTVDAVYTAEYLEGHRESPWGTTQRAQKEGLEFGEAEYKEIDAYCREKGLQWTASCWDMGSLDFLRDSIRHSTRSRHPCSDISPAARNRQGREEDLHLHRHVQAGRNR